MQQDFTINALAILLILLSIICFSVKFFNGDDDPIKYSGPRTLEALDKFIDEKLKSSDEVCNFTKYHSIVLHQ